VNELSEVEVVVREGVPVVRIRGEIDLSNVGATLRSIEAAVDESAPGLVVDLRELEFLDSAGVRLLFEAARLVTSAGGRFVALVSPGSPAVRVLELAEACDVPTQWSCRTGVCHTCATALLSGEASYETPPLEAPGHDELLICSAQPTTDLVIDL